VCKGTPQQQFVARMNEAENIEFFQPLYDNESKLGRNFTVIGYQEC
jgi:hypothetical protein